MADRYSGERGHLPLTGHMLRGGGHVTWSPDTCAQYLSFRYRYLAVCPVTGVVACPLRSLPSGGCSQDRWWEIKSSESPVSQAVVFAKGCTMAAKGLSSTSIASLQNPGGLSHAPRPALPAIGPHRPFLRQHGSAGRRAIQIARAVEAPPSPFVPPPPPPSSPEIPADELKALLLDTLFGSERGLTASSEIRAEVNEIITQVRVTSPGFKLVRASSHVCVLGNQRRGHGH